MVTTPSKPSVVWYKKWWGIVLIVLFLWPYFLVWYMWAHTSWSKNVKVGVTAAAAILFIIVLAAGSSGSKATQTKSTADTKKQPPATHATSAKPAAKVATRQVTGTATTLGAGTFTGGKDVKVGLYDVTPGAGQSGNFTVDGSDSYNEILGGDSSLGGVPKVRVKISSGDKIEISGLSSVAFTPVATPFVTTHTATSLYAGTFVVGQDIGAGRYVVTPGAGQSGNFMVDGANSYNEILGGDSSLGGVPRLTVNLAKGDTIDISGLSQATFTPSN